VLVTVGLLCVFLLVCSCNSNVSTAPQQLPPKPGPLAKPFAIDGHFSAFLPVFSVPSHDISDRALTLAKIQTALHQNPIHSVEEFLKWLKTSGNGDYLRSFVLMPKSQSVQGPGCTFAHPRIVLHKDRLFIGLTGEPGNAKSLVQLEKRKAKLYQELEMLEYEPHSNVYLSGEVTFPNPLVKLNQESCQGCHGESMIPIWSPPPLVAGSYGGGGAKEQVGLTPVELENFKAFYQAVKDDTSDPSYDRYRALEFQEPLFVGDNEAEWAANRYAFRALPNHHMFAHLAYLNHYHMMRVLQQSAHYHAYQYAIMAAFTQCDAPVTDYLPERTQKEHEAIIAEQSNVADILRKPGVTVMAALQSDTFGGIEADYKDRLFRYNRLNSSTLSNPDFPGLSASESSPELLVRLRYLVEGQGVDMTQWSLVFQGGLNGATYTMGAAGSGYFTAYMFARDFLVPAMTVEDPMVAQYLETVPLHKVPIGLWNFPERPQFCDYLKKRSLEEVGKL